MTGMPVKRVIGIVTLVVGLVLLYFGWQSSESVGEQLHETVTGRYTDETMWYLIVGTVASVAGLLLTFVGGRRS